MYPFGFDAKNQRPELLIESELSYATGTQVHVQFAENEAVYAGEIMGYNPNGVVQQDAKKSYSVIIFTEMNNAQMYRDVDEDMIRYRIIGKPTEENKPASFGES